MSLKNKLLITTASLFLSVSAAPAQQALPPAEIEKLLIRSERNLTSNIQSVQRLEGNPPSSFDPSKKFADQTAEGKKLSHTIN